MNGPEPLALAVHERRDGARPADFAELAAALGLTWQAVQKRSTKESWPFEEQPVRGGKKRLFPLSNLPVAVRDAVTASRLHQSIVSSSAASRAEAGAVSSAAAPLPAVEPSERPAGLSLCGADLTDGQRLERDARSGVVAAIRRFQDETGCSQQAAMQTLLTLAVSGRADPLIVRSLQLARDGRGRKGQGGGLPSIRTLKRWIAAPDLTPRIVQKNMSVPFWAPGFLRYYQVPQKPTVEAAYRDFCATWDGDCPSIHQVRRFIGKLGTVTRERGRMGERELKNIRPFIRRAFDHLEPNDVWSADGHTFDAEVQHPLHGRPFRPEITTIVDIATRRAIGWSVDLAESGLAVVDALRHGVTEAGVPAIFYVDNGSGYKNAMMTDEATGLMGRLHISMENSIPYNSQARGVIERLHQTLWVAAAKQLPSYVGSAMDREARLEQFKLTRRALKQGGALPLIPWDVFTAFCADKVAEYNARPHRSLKGTSPDLAWRAFAARGWSPEPVRAEILPTLFRPRVTRKLIRAEIRLFNNIYFARELEEFHGLSAQIAYDIHDPTRVWVYTPEGRLICEAQVDGNRRAYFPVPVIQQKREERAKGRLKRIDAKRGEILEELHGAPAIAAPASTQIVLGGRVIDAATLEMTVESAPEPRQEAARLAIGKPEAKARSDRSPAENYAEWQALDTRLKAGEAISDDDARWHRMYPGSAQYRAEAAKRKAAA